MKEIIKISIKDLKPEQDDVFKAQGIPPGKEPSGNVASLFKTAMELFLKSSQPIGIISEISIPEFEVVYDGESLNEKRICPFSVLFNFGNCSFKISTL